MPKHSLQKLHLGLSALVVIGVAIIYGANPTKLPSVFFDFNVQSVDLKNIFRAMMGLYLAIASYWIYGIIRPIHWRSATLVNIIFMGGLAFGRILSSFLDGFSIPFTKGLILELIFLIWGLYNLKYYDTDPIKKNK